MKITINGKKAIIEEGATVAGLIALKDLNPDTIIVEYNDDLIKKGEWSDIALQENDRLEILRFVGGG